MSHFEKVYICYFILKKISLNKINKIYNTNLVEDTIRFFLETATLFTIARFPLTIFTDIFVIIFFLRKIDIFLFQELLFKQLQ